MLSEDVIMKWREPTKKSLEVNNEGTETSIEAVGSPAYIRIRRATAELTRSEY
jgi:hypothetical protein